MTETVTLGQLAEWMRAFQRRVTAERDYLTELDAKIGDADHGSNMVRGVNAVVARLTAEPPATVADFAKTVGMTLVSAVGGASGPLYGTFFLRAGIAAPDGARELSGSDLIAMLAAGVAGVRARGKAEVGDKTMVDVLAPALAAAEAAAGTSLRAGVDAAVAAAERAAQDSKRLVARRGRASYLGERSLGHVDPGSASSVLLFAALQEVIHGGTP